ncbi:MAG: ABC transporter permease, partial [Actinobacteria bacterium]|nr:ABC transporter permease [Actinomycetota bacterium]
MSRASRVRGFVAPSIALVIYLALAAYPPIWEAVLGRMFPGESRLLYQQAGMLTLIGQHATMVGISSLASAIIGISLGVFVTRPVGADFHDTVADLANLGQTFPPIAVLTLAVPLLGFGFEPTVFALTLYGVLPVLQNTIAGIRSIPAAITESARGMGMTPAQVLFRAELPAAAG